MTEDTLKYVKEIAVRNYTNVILLLIGVIAVTLALNNPATLVLLKLCVVPSFYLSLLGLRSIYRDPIVEHRVTARSLEYTILQALLVSLFFCILLWTTESTTTEIFRFFFLSLLVFSGLNFIRLMLNIRAIKADRQ